MALGSFGNTTEGGASSFGSYKRKQNELSFQQMLALSLAAKQHNRSFLGNVLHGGVHGLSFVMKQILRPSYGMAEGARRALQGEGFDAEDFVKGFSRGFQLKTHTTFSNVLSQEFPKWSREHKTLKGLAGLGLDIVTDPTLPLQVGAIVATGGAAAPEIIAARVLMRTAGEVGVAAAARKTAAQKAIATFDKLGEGFTAHKSQAVWESIAAEREMKAALGQHSGPLLSDAEQASYNLAQKMAEDEFKRTGPQLLQASYKIPFAGRRVGITPTKIGGMRVAPKALTLERAAAKEGLIGKIPGVSGTATHIGKIFRHGFGEEEWMKPLLMTAHFENQLFDQYMRHGAATIGAAIDKHAIKDPEEMWQALTWAESRHNLIQGAGRNLDESVLHSGIEKGSINAGQADFIKAWHQHTEMLRRRDNMFGVKYDKNLPENKIYVPHLFEQHGLPLKQSDISIPGFSKKRVGNLTAEEMHRVWKAQQSKEGWLTREQKNLVTDPMEIMGIRTRRGAQAHGTETLLRNMRMSGGVPHRIADTRKMAKWVKEMKHQEARMKKHQWMWERTGAANESNKQYLKIGKEYKRRSKNIDKKYRAMRMGAPFLENKKTGEIIYPKSSWKGGAVPGYKAHKARTFGGDPTGAKNWHDKIIRAHVRAVERLDKWQAAERVKAKEALNARKETGLREIGQAWKKHQQLAKLVEKGAFKKNPNIPAEFQKVTRKIDGEYYHFKPEIADAMSRVTSAMRSDEELQKLASSMQKAMAKWKIGVTSINPGYRIRNSLSDMWNAYISGVPAWGLAKYGGRAAVYYKAAQNVQKKLVAAEVSHVPVELTKMEQQALRHFYDATNHGLMSGLFQGDVNLVAQILAKGGVSGFRRAKTLAKEGHLIGSYARVMQEFNMHAENWGRFAHYLYRRESEKLGVQESADWVKKAHFDYTELTPTEQEKFKKVIPFYTWSRKNIPYQLTRMVAQPGRFATFPKVVTTSSELAGGDTHEGLMPEWLREKWAFQVPFFGKQTYMTPMIGVGDLARLEGNPVSELLSMAGPWVKVPFEVATGRSTFTGQEIDTGRKEPIGGLAASILKFVPGADVGRTARSPHGERVEGPGASPWISYFAGQLPLSQTLLHVGDPITSKKRGSAGRLSYKNLGYLTGLPLYNRDPETEAVVAEIQLQEQVARLLKELRDSGKLPPAKKQKRSSYQDMLRQVQAGR